MKHIYQIIIGALVAIAFLYLAMEVQIPDRDPEGFGALLKEIQSADDTFTALTPSDKSVYFIYTSANSNVLAYIDSGSTNIRTVPGATNVSAIYRFSENQSQLIIQTQDVEFVNRHGVDSERLKWLAVVDTITKGVTRLSTNTAVQESSPIWLSTNEIIFESVDYSSSEVTKSRWYVDLKTMSIADSVQVPHLTKSPQISDLVYSLSPVSPGRILIRSQGSLQLLEIESGAVRTLFPERSNFLSSPAWVNVRPNGDDYLFCATPTDSTNRLLFRGRLDLPLPTRLSDVHSYNGKWLSGSNSFAFIASTNNCFFLRVVVDGNATNLFTDGWCRTFTPSPDGTRVFAEASVNSGPCGLWEFNIPLSTLRQVAAGNKMPLKMSTVTKPEILRVQSFDGFGVPVYRFPPRTNSERSYRGLVIAIPPRTDQCNRYYQTRPQFLSNLGFDYCGINYRGCDGYGTAYANLYSPKSAAMDVIAVAKELVSRFGRPGFPVFLIAQSEGAVVLASVIESESRMWDACALVRPVPLDARSFRHLSRRVPLQIIIGRNDPAYSSIRDLSKNLKADSRLVEMSVINNYTHLNVDPIGRETEEASVARFFLRGGR